MQGGVAAGGDGQAQSFAVVGADLQAVGDDLLARAVDVDPGADGVLGLDLALALADFGVVGELDLEELLAGADAVEADAVFEPVGVAQAPAQDGSEVALAAGGADGPVDGEVEHDGG